MMGEENVTGPLSAAPMGTKSHLLGTRVLMSFVGLSGETKGKKKEERDRRV